MRHLFFLPLAACILALSACGSSDVSPAQAIVDKAIEANGGKQFENLRLAFDFRDLITPAVLKKAIEEEVNYTVTNIELVSTKKE